MCSRQEKSGREGQLLVVASFTEIKTGYRCVEMKQSGISYACSVH